MEIFLRGTIVYLFLFALFRAVLKRQSGSTGITDLLVVVLIADAAQNAMGDDYRSIPDGLVLVTVIVFWSHALEWLGYRFRFLKRFVHPRALPLIRDGRLLRRNMHKELITEEELHSLLRQQGVTDIGSVKEAFMEGDGHISVVPKESEKSRG